MLDSEMLAYTTIIYQLSRGCNAACSVCCESSSPKLDEKMDLDIILDNIGSVRNLNGIKGISITGGEPFLYPGDVLSIAEQCKKIGRSFGVTTNAFWCESYSRTFSVLSQLKRKNDSIKLTVSVDAFHQEYVPVERVRVLLRVCKDLEVHVDIQTCLTKSTFARTEEILSDLGIDKLHAKILYGAAYPVGMAKKRLENNDFFTKRLIDTRCLNMHALLVEPDGCVHPCCSPCHADIPFGFGNIHSDSLKDILDDLRDNGLMRMIAIEGFDPLLEEAQKELGFVTLNEYVDVCHLCNHLLGDADRYSYLQEKARDWMYATENTARVAHW